jgi:hypothetical protein
MPLVISFGRYSIYPEMAIEVTAVLPAPNLHALSSPGSLKLLPGVAYPADDDLKKEMIWDALWSGIQKDHRQDVKLIKAVLHRMPRGPAMADFDTLAGAKGPSFSFPSSSSLKES